ncbi:MAG: lipoyl synthase [Candidatus Melainabacteria bacterium GWF2_37_15]|nr:MAG: lipoyl synthase [Candidatus Melainabacteria bacterium GWF2_37_15]
MLGVLLVWFDVTMIKQVLEKYNLNTICQQAMCPNIRECWSNKAATFLLLGNVCTRNCRFCSVKTGTPTYIPDLKEAYNLANAVKELGLKYVVLTSVDRDDLKDSGAGHFAQTIKTIKKFNPNTLVEALIPDFNLNIIDLKRVIYAEPDILGHNIETVRDLSPKIRDKRADYDTSLRLLGLIKDINPDKITKSSLLLGLGETNSQVKESLHDLRNYNVDMIVIGQYLRPTRSQIPVQRYITPEEFEEYKVFAQDLGFSSVVSYRLARTSFRAFKQSIIQHNVNAGSQV